MNSGYVCYIITAISLICEKYTSKTPTEQTQRARNNLLTIGVHIQLFITALSTFKHNFVYQCISRTDKHVRWVAVASCKTVFYLCATSILRRLIYSVSSIFSESFNLNCVKIYKKVSWTVDGIKDPFLGCMNFTSHFFCLPPLKSKYLFDEKRHESGCK